MLFKINIYKHLQLYLYNTDKDQASCSQTSNIALCKSHQHKTINYLYTYAGSDSRNTYKNLF